MLRACALDRPRRHRRLLRPRHRQSRSAAADRRPLPGRPRLPRRPRLRPHPAGRRDLHPRRQRLLRAAGQAPGGAHRPDRRLRAALRHQHGLALRARLPGHAAGEDAGDRGRRAGSGADRLAGGSLRDASAPASIELACAPIAERLRKATPRAALLSTLAGIALSFISLGFLFRTFARPIVGLTTLAIVMLTYFGRVRFKGRIPGGVLAVAVGTLLAWLTGIAPVGAASRRARRLHLPIPVVGDLCAAIARRPSAGPTSR